MSKIFDWKAVDAALQRAAEKGVSGTRAERSGRFVLNDDEDKLARQPGIPAELVANRITIDPEVCGGGPCIRGLRIRVKDILDMLAGGSTRQEILADHPYLEDEDITAALEYASRATDHPVIAAAE